MDRYKDLRDLRYKNGDLSQAEMAEKIGIAASNYSLIESGKRNGARRTWLKIQEVFGLSDGEVWRMQNRNQ